MTTSLHASALLEQPGDHPAVDLEVLSWRPDGTYDKVLAIRIALPSIDAAVDLVDLLERIWPEGKGQGAGDSAGPESSALTHGA